VKSRDITTNIKVRLLPHMGAGSIRNERNTRDSPGVMDSKKTGLSKMPECHEVCYQARRSEIS